MNPFDNSVQNLSQLWGPMSPLPYIQNLGQSGNSNLWNMGELAKQQQDYQQSQEQFPLEQQLRQQRITAGDQSNQAGALNLDKLKQTHASDIQTALAQNKGKLSQLEYEELKRMGDTFSMAGPLIEHTPGEITHDQAKKILGKYYRPEFDQITPNALGGYFSHVGQLMQLTAGDYQKKLSLQNDMQAFKEAENEKNRQAAEHLAKVKLELKAQTDKTIAEAKAANKFGNLEQHAAMLRQKAMEIAPTNPDMAKALREEADRLLKAKSDMQVRAASAANPAKVNPESLGMDTIPVPPAPQIEQPQTTPSRFPAPKTQAEYDKLPSGTVYIDTDGKTKRKK